MFQLLSWQEISDRYKYKKRIIIFGLQASLVLNNSALWGGPVVAATINNGNMRFQQANFFRCGIPWVNVYGGEIYVYSSYFADRMPDAHISLIGV